MSEIINIFNVKCYNHSMLHRKTYKYFKLSESVVGTKLVSTISFVMTETIYLINSFCAKTKVVEYNVSNLFLCVHFNVSLFPIVLVF